MYSTSKPEAIICARHQWLRERMKYQKGVTILFVENSFDSPMCNQLLMIISLDHHYLDVRECIDYIKNASNENILLVTVLAEDARTVLSACEKLPQLRAVYVLKQLPTAEPGLDNKRIHFDDNPTHLFEQLCLDACLLDHDEPVFRFFDHKQSSTMSLTTEGAAFMWSQILIDALKEAPLENDAALDDLTNIFKDAYPTKPHTLREIDQFRTDYRTQDVIHWYTCKQFFYQSLNAALRTEDINALYSFRLLIVDLCDQLEEQHRLYLPTKTTLTVYHGQYMSKTDIDQLQSNIGSLMSTNSFWSTSFDKEVAIIFAGAGQPRPEQHSVLFQIDVDTRLKSTLFAPIEGLSGFPEEKELLFGLRSVFNIHSVQEDSENGWWLVHLIATDEGREKYQEYKQILRKEAEADNILIIFGCLMIFMGKHAKAADYFAKLTERLPKDDIMLQGSFRRHYARSLYLCGKYKQAHDLLTEGLAIYGSGNVSSESINYLQLQFNLANVYMFMERYNDALNLYQHIFDTQQRVLPPDHRDIGETLSGLSWAYGKLSKPQLAIEYSIRALHFFQQTLPSNHPAIPRALKGLAGLYKSRGELELALNYQEQALAQSQQYLPKDHPTIATILREIGDIYESKNNHPLALEYDLRSYDIQTKNYPDGHILVASTLRVIGNLYRHLKQFDDALKYHYTSLEIREKLQPPDNFLSKHDLGETYLAMGNTKEAIECFEFTYKTKTTEFGTEHASTMLTKTYLGIAYSQNGDFAHAEQIFDEVLVTQRALYPNGGSQIGITLRCMASNYLKMNNIDQAVRCFEDSLQMLERFLPLDHYEVKLVKGELLRLRERQQNEQYQ